MVKALLQEVWMVMVSLWEVDGRRDDDKGEDGGQLGSQSVRQYMGSKKTPPKRDPRPST